MGTDNISNSQDVIDSRHIIARIDELTDLQDTLEQAKTDLAEASEDQRAKAQDALDNAQSDFTQDEADELEALTDLSDEAFQYSRDWKYGAQLIREDYFVDYAKEFAKDVGDIKGDEQWPLNHIDWDAAAAELQQDYTEVDFDGVTYYMLNS
jgi:hypothetical protein